MHFGHGVRIAGALGLCLLTAVLVRRACPVFAPPLSAPRYRLAPGLHVSRSEAARWAGWRYRIQAKQAVVREIEALEEWDLQVFGHCSEQRWYQELIRRDRQGDLGRARAAAREAAAWARTPDEAYRAALLLSYLDSHAGDHQAELWQAQKMMALRPHEEASIGALLHAARCNDLKPLARRAAAALKALREGAPE